jgi:hypothetical protein
MELPDKSRRVSIKPFDDPGKGKIDEPRGRYYAFKRNSSVLLSKDERLLLRVRVNMLLIQKVNFAAQHNTWDVPNIRDVVYMGGTKHR